MAVPVLSVVVCTWNRSDGLAACLAQLLADIGARSDVEVVVVANNCTDDTVPRVRQLQSGWSTLRLVEEPSPGLSVARNTGIEASRGAVIAFLDDDAEVRPGWTDAMCSVFEDPAVTAAGGKIVLRWPADRPAWLPRRFDKYYTCLDLGDRRMRMPVGNDPYGANMAFRADALARGFDVALGRRGADLTSSEEEVLFEHLRRLDAVVVYVPDAAVDHVVPTERAKPRWLLRRMFAQGVSDALVARGAGTEPRGEATIDTGPQGPRRRVGRSLDLARGLLTGVRSEIASLPVLVAGKTAHTIGFVRERYRPRSR